jgi:hypothetical protein
MTQSLTVLPHGTVESHGNWVSLGVDNGNAQATHIYDMRQVEGLSMNANVTVGAFAVSWGLQENILHPYSFSFGTVWPWGFGVTVGRGTSTFRPQKWDLSSKPIR